MISHGQQVLDGDGLERYRPNSLDNFQAPSLLVPKVMEIDGGYINYVSGRRQLSLDELLGDYYPLCSTYLNKLRTYVYHNSQYNAPNKLIAIRIIYVEYMRVMSEIIVYVHHTFTMYI
ncbi:hypothetical protein KSF78_0001295 [Schistosoma japonicum]|nr:hypothetical protein KSF78_0001295 [Schistosoma japonicum]